MLTRLLERLDLSLTQNPSSLLDTMFLERRDGRHQRDRSLATNDGGGRKSGEDSRTKRAISGRATSAGDVSDGGEGDSESPDDGGRDGAGGNGRGSDNIILKSRNADSQDRIRKRETQALQAHIRKREHQSALPVNAHLNEEVLRVSWQDETRTGTAPILPVL